MRKARHKWNENERRKGFTPPMGEFIRPCEMQPQVLPLECGAYCLELFVECGSHRKMTIVAVPFVDFNPWVSRHALQNRPQKD